MAKQKKMEPTCPWQENTWIGSTSFMAVKVAERKKRAQGRMDTNKARKRIRLK